MSLGRGWRIGLGSGARGCELVDLAGLVDAEFGEQVAGGLGGVGELPEGAGRAGEGADVDAVDLAADLRPGGPGLVLGDADEQEGEPAEDDVGADALFEPVVDRPQVRTDFMSRQPRSTSRSCL